MALKLDLDKITAKKALENLINVHRRNNTAEINPAMRDLREKDITALRHAIDTMAEIK